MGNAGCKDGSGKITRTNDQTDHRSSSSSSSARGKKSLVEACGVDELKDGQMKEVVVGEGKVLLVREAGSFHAIGAKCTHFGAPLVKGVLCNGHVRCPWHGACFNIRTGDIEDFPGLDSVPRFETHVKGNKVFIDVRPDALTSHKRVRPMVKRNKASKESIVIIGGGPAGLTCAETLRIEGFDGQIVILSKESHLPYDRSKLSKSMKASAEELLLRDKKFFADHDIEYRPSSEVAGINTESKEVKLKTGASVPYSRLLIATGGTPRRLDIDGAQLKGIHVLRTIDDANAVVAAVTDKHVVVVGLSFVGIESACFFSDKAKSVTVVGNGEHPLPLGQDIGIVVRKLLEDHDVTFRWKTSPKSFGGQGGVLTSVNLSDGSTLQADVCLLGIGVTPNTEFLRESSVSLNSNGHINVNEYLETTVSGVFAAGDITSVPLAQCSTTDKVNIQHWQMAHKQGQVAAYNMLSQPRSTPLKSVPFFWTVIFGKNIRYAGYATHTSSANTIVHKEDEFKLLVFYVRNDLVTAIASINFDPVVAYFADMLLAGQTLSRNDISNGNIKTWLEKIQQTGK